jgi:hypothetical protein
MGGSIVGGCFVTRSSVDPNPDRGSFTSGHCFTSHSQSIGQSGHIRGGCPQHVIGKTRKGTNRHRAGRSESLVCICVVGGETSVRVCERERDCNSSTGICTGSVVGSLRAPHEVARRSRPIGFPTATSASASLVLAMEEMVMSDSPCKWQHAPQTCLQSWRQSNVGEGEGMEKSGETTRKCRRSLSTRDMNVAPRWIGRRVRYG